MIIIYYRSKCSSSVKAINWLEKRGIPYQKRKIEQISQERLYHILSLTDNGFFDIFKKKGNSVTQSKIEYIIDMNFDNAIKYICNHTEVLRTPVLFSSNKLLIGHDDIEIRKFIPKKSRNI